MTTIQEYQVYVSICMFICYFGTIENSHLMMLGDRDHYFCGLPHIFMLSSVWQWKWTTFCRERDLNTRFSVDLVFVALWVKYINSENVLTLWGFILNIMTYRRISVPGFVCSSCCIAVGDCVHYHLL